MSLSAPVVFLGSPFLWYTILLAQFGVVFSAKHGLTGARFVVPQSFLES